MTNLPARIGPCRFGRVGSFWIAVCCPSDYDALMSYAGGFREPGGRRWLLRRHRIGLVLQVLRIRHAGLDLDRGVGQA